MLEHGAGAYAGALRALAQPDALPAVFFCMAGKDRTGVFAAVLLGLLGVADDDIVADYALTHEVIDQIHERTRATRPTVDEVWDRLPADLKGANAATMRELLGLLRDRWGSPAGYVTEIGVDDATVTRLRNAVLRAA